MSQSILIIFRLQGMGYTPGVDIFGRRGSSEGKGHDAGDLPSLSSRIKAAIRKGCLAKDLSRRRIQLEGLSFSSTRTVFLSVLSAAVYENPSSSGPLEATDRLGRTPASEKFEGA